MASYEHISIMTLILALSLSTTDVSLATRYLLDTPKVSTADLASPMIPSDLPVSHSLHPFLIQPKTTFSLFHQLPKVSAQRILTNSSFPNMPTDPKVKLLPPPATTQLPTIPTTIPSIPIMPSKLPTIPHLPSPPSKLDTSTVLPTADLALAVIPYDRPMLRALHPKSTVPPIHPLPEVSTQPTLTKSHWVPLPLHRRNELHPSTRTLPLLP